MSGFVTLKRPSQLKVLICKYLNISRYLDPKPSQIHNASDVSQICKVAKSDLLLNVSVATEKRHAEVHGIRASSLVLTSKCGPRVFLETV